MYWVVKWAKPKLIRIGPQGAPIGPEWKTQAYMNHHKESPKNEDSGLFRWNLDESPQKGQSATSLPIIKASPSPCKNDLIVMEALSLLLNIVAGSLPYIKICSTYSGAGESACKENLDWRSIYLYFPPSPARKGCMGQTLMSHWFRYDEIIIKVRESQPEYLTRRLNMSHIQRRVAGLCPLNALEIAR